MTLKIKTLSAFAAIALILTAAFSLTGCRKSTPEENLEAAQTAVANGDFESAARTIDAIGDETGESITSVNTLINLAIVCMEVNEQRPDQAYDATALFYFKRARQLAPDSVDYFLQTANIEQVKYLATLLGLQRAMELDGNYPEEGHADTDQSDFDPNSDYQ